MLIDLQLHSTYSDGYLTPTETTKFATSQGIKVAALTDHNTVGGLDEFRRACRQHKIKPITGLEIYARLKHRKFNLLWFNFDDKSPELHKLLRESQIRRRGNVRNILRKLEKEGLKMNINKIIDKYNHYIPINRLTNDIYSIPHNRALIKKTLQIKNPREEEIIKECFRNKKTGILHETYINIERILTLRKKIGGQLILNHPAKSSYVTRESLIELKKIGIDGIEVLSPHHSIAAVMYLQSMAYELDFIATGSSDFHLHKGGNYSIQNSWNYYKIDSKYLRKIKKIIG
jgi:hypothetical protein